MKTYLECIPCFFRQLLEGARTVNASHEQQKRIIDEFSGNIPNISLNASPPEIACSAYSILRKIIGSKDPYLAIKRKSNRMALDMYCALKSNIKISRNRLLAATELAIAGNVIDFGVKNNLNIGYELEQILSEKAKGISKRSNIFDYRKFADALEKSKRILYIADNAGEVVFDRLLIEEIKSIYPDKTVFYSVKARPIINDALIEDARQCGITGTADIISNGADAPGTIMRMCSRKFRNIFDTSDMVISKGQGNYESLSDENKPIFFLFMVKCPVVAKETGCEIGQKVLFYNNKTSNQPQRRKR